jgi:hypothetical protein
MPSWTRLREMDVTLADPTPSPTVAPPDVLADPLSGGLDDPLLASRKAEQAAELAALGSGRGLAGVRGDGTVVGDMRDMTADSIFGLGTTRFAGLSRSEDVTDAATKASRQEEWDRQKAQPGGVSLAQRAVHKADKVTGRFGADVASRYATKAKRGVQSSGALKNLGVPGVQGKGAAGFYGGKGWQAGAKRLGERAARRGIGTMIGVGTRLVEGVPFAGPAIGAARDGALAAIEEGRVRSAGAIAARDGVDDLTASLAHGSRRRHERRRDESALKATTKGAMAPTPIPWAASGTASAAATLKSGADHVRSKARATRLAAAGGDDDALLRLPQEDEAYRHAMMDYLEVPEAASGEMTASKALGVLRNSENEAGYSVRDDKGRIELEESISDSDSATRIDVMDPTADTLVYDPAIDPTLSTWQNPDAVRALDLTGAEQRTEIGRRGALLEDFAMARAVAGRQARVTGQLGDKQDHTLRPSMTAKRSAGEAARKRQKARTGDDTLAELRSIDRASWLDSRMDA